MHQEERKACRAQGRFGRSRGNNQQKQHTDNATEAMHAAAIMQMGCERTEQIVKSTTLQLVSVPVTHHRVVSTPFCEYITLWPNFRRH